MNASAIIVAGGKGLRMKDKMRKQYLSLAGLPILAHTLSAFNNCRDIQEIILAVPKDDMAFCQKNIISLLKLNKKLHMVAGGRERQDSVFNGLMAVNNPVVAIHDGVRPFILPSQITDTLSNADKKGACILGIPAFDTLKQINAKNCIQKTIDRKSVWLAQTPQSFQYNLILKAHKTARRDKYTGTDDASLVERMGAEVQIIQGTRFNIKITTPEDLKLAQAINKFF